jgi:hypothetical protein
MTSVKSMTLTLTLLSLLTLSIVIPLARPSSPCKVVVESRKNLGEVLKNKNLKKKFGKAIMRLFDPVHGEVVVGDDFMDYSFYFVKFNKDGDRDYNGGLIFHKNYENPIDLTKGHYSVHT